MTFEFELPDMAVEKVFMDWAKLVNAQKQPSTNKWEVLPFLPKYRFKNLKVQQFSRVDEDFNSELTITLFCDEYQMIENILDFKKVSRKLSHSEDRFPYTYHHDYLRQKDKFKDMSRGDIAELRTWTEEELYSTSLIQILNECGVIEVLNSLDQDDMDICRKALHITDKYITKITQEEDGE